MTRAVATITEGGRTFRHYRYSPTEERSARFDGAAFLSSWARFVGSAHRDHQTGELVLCWSIEGPHPQQRETLRGRLEADRSNVGTVLAALDAKPDRHQPPTSLRSGAVQ